MIFRLTCPRGHVLDVDARLAGRRIRCGACGAIMVVPRVSVKSPAKKPTARPTASPLSMPAAIPRTPSVAEPLSPPPAKPSPKAPEKPLAKRPTAEPPLATPPSLTREAGMVAVPLEPVRQPEIADPSDHEVPAMRLRPKRFSYRSWFARLWRPSLSHLPADTTIPGKAERRIALQLAAAMAVVALVSLLPVIGKGYGRLHAAPTWALATVSLASVQLFYAARLVNAPDWVSAWIQMVVCAISTTIYGMLTTLTTITPVNHQLILGLGEVRSSAPAWCGLMFILTGAVTWWCGVTSMKWKKSLSRPSAD
jgi:hypothetical protein